MPKLTKAQRRVLSLLDSGPAHLSWHSLIYCDGHVIGSCQDVTRYALRRHGYIQAVVVFTPEGRRVGSIITPEGREALNGGQS